MLEDARINRIILHNKECVWILIAVGAGNNETKSRMKFNNILFSTVNFENYKDLLIVLTHKEIKVRYKSSVLGYHE
jgi:hypothetical protein